MYCPLLSTKRGHFFWVFDSFDLRHFTCSSDKSNGVHFFILFFFLYGDKERIRYESYQCWTPCDNNEVTSHHSLKDSLFCGFQRDQRVYWKRETHTSTTADSSATGLELSTDDYRQPTGITDENCFFFLWWKSNFFYSKNGDFYTKNGVFMDLPLVCTIFFVYVVYTLFVR